MDVDVTINTDVTMRDAAPAGGAKRFRAGDEILGRYVVEAELGQGGMGVVYLCLDKVGGVKVAVKGLPPEVSHSAYEMDCVRDNYQLVSELRHANIAGYRTLEQDANGDYYLVMDLARGMGLNRWIRQNGKDADVAKKIAILRQIADALDYAHSHKPTRIIHRDIKPGNIMVDEGGHVMLLDFGLAAQIRSSFGHVSLEVLSQSGTRTYKAPEQWRGQPQRAATDQYALGVVAYEMLSGGLPFDDDDEAVLRQAVLNEPVADIDGLPASMNAALKKAMAKQGEGRFATCGAFIDALEGKTAATARVAPDRMRIAIVVGIVLLIVALAGCWLLLGHGRGGSGQKTAVPKLEQVMDVSAPKPIESKPEPESVSEPKPMPRPKPGLEQKPPSEPELPAEPETNRVVELPEVTRAILERQAKARELIIRKRQEMEEILKNAEKRKAEEIRN